MDDMKRIYREGEEKTKEGARELDGHDLGDDLGNLGDDARKTLGNMGDDLRRGRREGSLDDDLDRDRTITERQDY